MRAMLMVLMVVALMAGAVGCADNQTDFRQQAAGAGLAVYLLAASGFEGRVDVRAEAPTAFQMLTSWGFNGQGELSFSGNIDAARMKPIDANTLKDILDLLGEPASAPVPVDDSG